MAKGFPNTAAIRCNRDAVFLSSFVDSHQSAWLAKSPPYFSDFLLIQY